MKKFHGILTTFFTSATFLVLTGCQSGPPKAPILEPIVPAKEVPANADSVQQKSKSDDLAISEANLTFAEAMARSQVVSDIQYRLSIELDAKNVAFVGREHIEFRLRRASPELFLDFKDGAQLGSFTVNGQAVTPIYRHHRLSVGGYLTEGVNTIDLSYSQSYSHEGRGLHRFVDPEDGRVYLYSQFEQYDAHQMFACFDQPNLKATMELQVTAPTEWQVVSTTRETSKAKVADGRTLWDFATTPKISTYLFSLHAGPYQVWTSQVGSIPTRLFARQAMKKYVPVDVFQRVTEQGLKFYGSYFDYPYPFQKYDQLIVPEFNAGAMENVAAVTFSERFVHRGPMTDLDREWLTDTILHEMAHMWFGDLVTMSWWNDTWLNESFASYMAALSSARVTEFKDEWRGFQEYYKARAYVEDQQVITHPIAAHIPDVHSADANFDDITYGKGAAVLKQLHFLLGEDGFRDGLRRYFKENAYQNTKREDFLAALELESERDLSDWSKVWLEAAGLDTVQAAFTCEAGKINSFNLLASPPSFGDPQAHRLHSTLVALYGPGVDQPKTLQPYETIKVEYGIGQTPVTSVIGHACPKMVYPNEGDYDYVKVRLDEASLKVLQASLYSVASSLTRTMIWQNLMMQVRDVRLQPQQYLEIVKTNLLHDPATAAMVIQSLPDVLYYLPRSTPEERVDRAVRISELERLLWRMAGVMQPGSDLQRFAVMGLAKIAESSEAKDRLVSLLTKPNVFKGFVADADDRWEMIIHLASLGDKRAEPLLTAQKKADPSLRGVDNASAVEASRPILSAKQKWLKTIVSETALSYASKRRILKVMMPQWQDDLREALAKDYYAELPALVQSQGLELSSSFAKSLVPATCTRTSVERLAHFLAVEGEKLPAPVLKDLRSAWQEDSRCMDIRSHASRTQ